MKPRLSINTSGLLLAKHWTHYVGCDFRVEFLVDEQWFDPPKDEGCTTAHFNAQVAVSWIKPREEELLSDQLWAIYAPGCWRCWKNDDGEAVLHDVIERAAGLRYC